jgi:hypothetical protein
MVGKFSLAQNTIIIEMFGEDVTFAYSTSERLAAREAAAKAEEARKAEGARKEEETAKSVGFIALSDAEMTWEEAKAWCASKGGRLPRVDNSDSSNTIESVNIDGFGVAFDAPWPAGLPGVNLWTGTEWSGGGPGAAWAVYNNNGQVGYSGAAGMSYRAVCVP